MTAIPAGLLPGFRGSLPWLHEQESHKGRPYWPKGKSGVTLDPGLDVHHADWSLVESVVAPHITADQLARLKSVRHLTGIEARAACQDPWKVTAKTPGYLRKWWGRVADIRISRELAARLLPYIAHPYWHAITWRFPWILEAHGEVHTAMLSIAYNRGAGNKDLAKLRPWIEARDWAEVGREIARMQQDHPQEVIRKRRQLEGGLILAAMGVKA